MSATRNQYAKFFFGLAVGGCLIFGAILRARAQSLDIPPEILEDEYFIDEQTEAVSPPPRTIALRKLDDQSWSKATDKLDYTERVEERKKKNNAYDKTLDLPNFNSQGDKIQIIAIALALVLIALGIYSAMRQPLNKRVGKPDAQISPENIEQFLEKAQIDPMLAQALAASDYALAIRYQYLRCLQKLGLKQLVKLSAEKTNRQYLRELDNSGLKPEFARLTLFYENIWYGSVPINLPRYQELAMMYESFLKKIS
ncbi:MAG: DUF4129 domain-containing protein [Saprospiraceae bacterium]